MRNGKHPEKGYRSFRRNNAIKWKGVETDRIKQHPPLIKKVSKKGEVSYKETKE